MAKLFEQLNVSQEQVDAVEADSVSEGLLIPAGVTPVEIDKMFIRKTDKGAQMLEVDFKVKVEGKDEIFHWATCTQSGDEKGNKTTYTTKTGKEVNLPGVDQMTNLLAAAGVPSPNAEAGKVQFKDKEIDALCVLGVQGKKLKLGVTQYENFYNGNVSLRNDVRWFMNTAGKNKDGEEIQEKVAERIAKNPIKKLKETATTTSTAPAAGGGSEDVPKAWA